MTDLEWHRENKTNPTIMRRRTKDRILNAIIMQSTKSNIANWVLWLTELRISWFTTTITGQFMILTILSVIIWLHSKSRVFKWSMCQISCQINKSKYNCTLVIERLQYVIYKCKWSSLHWNVPFFVYICLCLYHLCAIKLSSR